MYLYHQNGSTHDNNLFMVLLSKLEAKMLFMKLNLFKSFKQYYKEFYNRFCMLNNIFY